LSLIVFFVTIKVPKAQSQRWQSKNKASQCLLPFTTERKAN
jgi:hypothetical protein